MVDIQQHPSVPVQTAAGKWLSVINTENYLTICFSASKHSPIQKSVTNIDTDSIEEVAAVRLVSDQQDDFVDTQDAITQEQATHDKLSPSSNLLGFSHQFQVHLSIILTFLTLIYMYLIVG